MEMKFSKKAIYGCFFYSILLSILYINNSSVHVRNVYAIITMLLCILNIIKSKDNCIPLVLHFQLLYYNYSVVFSQYLNKVPDYQVFYRNATESSLGIGIFCLLTFEFFSLILDINYTSFSKEKLYRSKSNVFISMGLLLLATIMAIVSFDWNAYGQRGAISSSYEYIGILLILGLYYAGEYRNKLVKYGYSALIFGLVLQGLIFGERVSALQFIFIWCFFFSYDNLKLKNIMIASLFGIVLMSMVGAFRSAFSMNGINISTIWNELTKRMLTFNGADLGYYCSLTFIMVANKVILATRWNLFFEFVKSIFLGNSASAYLPEFTRQYYSHWNGGFYPIYFYFYGGILLVIVASYIWNAFIKKCFTYRKKKYGELCALLSIYIVSIAARWYMYTPLSAYRPVLLFIISFYAIDLMSRVLSREVI